MESSVLKCINQVELPGIDKIEEHGYGFDFVPMADECKGLADRVP